MKFFNPEDFVLSAHPEIPTDKWVQMTVASIANAKLEREGKVVYKINNGYQLSWNENPLTSLGGEGSLKALLICIEPIEKCKHIKATAGIDFSFPHKTIIEYICECGARVKPSSFEEIK